MYPKSCTHRFKIAERRGELYELENGGSDEAARAPARAAASPRYAQNADGDAAVAVAEQQELSAFQLGQLELIRRQQSTVRRGLGQHRYRYTNSFLFLSPFDFSHCSMMRKVCFSMIHKLRKSTRTRVDTPDTLREGSNCPQRYEEADKFFCARICRA